MKIIRNKLIAVMLLSTLVMGISNCVYASEIKSLNGIQDKSNVLLWSDEFDDGNVNSNYWKAISEEDMEYGIGSAEPSWNFKPELCRESNGSLMMKSQISWDNSRSCLTEGKQLIASSRIVSKNLIECKYGRIDVRAKLPKGKGIWSTCYLMGDNTYGAWPYCGEMDFWEHIAGVNSQICQKVISKEFNELSGNEKKWMANIESPDTQYHLYSIEWFENDIKFYVDNNLTGSYSSARNSSSEVWPFDSPFYFVIDCRPREMQNSTISTEGWTKISENGDIYSYEDSMSIDYIRVYSLGKDEKTTNTSVSLKRKKPSKVKIKTAKCIKKRSVNIKFRKVKNAKKYQIQYATGKKFKKAVSKYTKKLTYRIKRLKKGKTYYIRVRGLNGVQKGKWSKIKKVVIK